MKDSDQPSKYFPSNIFEESVSIKISPHQNFAPYGIIELLENHINTLEQKINIQNLLYIVGNQVDLIRILKLTKFNV